jgi:GAF domain-containing protein
LISKHSVEAQGPIDPLVSKLDELESEQGEGPCLSALREHHTVVIDDMITESRWPRFCALAADLGVRSLMSFELFVTDQNLGALNLYSDQIGAFTDDSRFIGELLAQHASVALIGSAAETQFNDALSSRDAIGQAKGIIMERFNLDEFAAFDLLRRLSQQSNEKLVDLARKLNQTRGHPDQP